MNAIQTPSELSWFRHDLPASLVVFLVALPLCMGIAIASGMPPASGLISGILGGLLVGTLSGSPLQVSGPAAGLVVIVFEVVEGFGVDGLALVIMGAGAVQAIAGRMGLGQWFRAMAPAVVYAMLAGIGVLIFSSQFHVMIDELPRANGIENILALPGALFKALKVRHDNPNHLAAMLGLATVISIVVWGRFAPGKLKMVPGPLVGVGAAVFLAHVLEIPVRYVDISDDLLRDLTLPRPHEALRDLSWPLVGAVIAMAFVASAETLLCAGAVDRMQTRVETDYDKELFAQGIGNVACGVVGALPMTGVIVRSSANVRAGARTRGSAILHGIWLLLLIALAPQALRMIPTASLAAILVYTGYKLVDPEHVADLKSYGRGAVMVYVVTLVTIVAVDLLTGVLVGFALASGRLLLALTRMQVGVTWNPEQDHVDVRVEGAATFIGLPKLVRVLGEIPANVSASINVDRVGYVDHACLQAMADWQQRRQDLGTKATIDWDEVHARSERAQWPVGAGGSTSADRHRSVAEAYPPTK